jgi:hypothetical protein
MHDVIPLERQVEDLTKLVGLLFRKVALLQQEVTELDRARILDAQVAWGEVQSLSREIM